MSRQCLEQAGCVLKKLCTHLRARSTLRQVIKKYTLLALITPALIGVNFDLLALLGPA